VIVTYLDTKTGKRSDPQSGISWFELAANNWSCDCNRRRAFELSDEGERNWNNCLGSHRFLVVSVELEQRDFHSTPVDMADFNTSYPLELRRQHGLP